MAVEAHATSLANPGYPVSVPGTGVRAVFAPANLALFVVLFAAVLAFSPISYGRGDSLMKSACPPHFLGLFGGHAAGGQVCATAWFPEPFVVLGGVPGTTHDFKVFNAVVASDAIFVVNNFRRFDGTAEVPGHDKDVLPDPAPAVGIRVFRRVDKNIAFPGNIPTATIPSRVFGASPAPGFVAHEG
jgi:hypothetical protein